MDVKLRRNATMIPQELQQLIQGGEGITVEFKKSRTEITKDVYETVCAFSNRDGGHIFRTSFIFVCLWRRMFAVVTAVFLTVIMKLTLILRIIRTRCIDFMHERAEVIM